MKRLKFFLRQYYLICGGFIIYFFVFSCAGYKLDSKENGYLLKNVKVLVDGENRTGEFETFISQHPRAFFSFGGVLYDHVVDTDYEDTFENWKKYNPTLVSFMKTVFSEKSLLHLKYWYGDMFHNRLRNISDPPVFHDQAKTQLSAYRLQTRFKRKGYLNCEVVPQFSLEGESIEVVYHVNTNALYRIVNFEVDTASSKLAKLYVDTLKPQSLVKVGSIVNMDLFAQEVDRIKNWFLDHGYYFFQERFIHFNLDTTRARSTVHIQLKIDAKPVQISPSSQMIFASDRPYHIKKFRVHIGDTYDKSQSDSVSIGRKGSIIYDQREKTPFAPAFIADRIYLQEGSFYSKKNKEDTYNKLLSSNNFTSAVFDIDPDTLGNLNADIYLSRRNKYSFSMEPNVTYSDSRWSVAGDVSLQRRNLFSYGEYLNFFASGSLGTLQNTAASYDFWNSWTINTGVEFVFQKLLIPGLKSDFSPDVFPKTRLSFSIDIQKNIGLGKVFYNAFWGYSITHGHQPMIHSINLIDLQYSRLLDRGRYFDIFPAQAKVVDGYLEKYKEYDPLKELDRLAVINKPPQQEDFISKNRSLHENFLFASQTYRRVTDDYLIASLWYRFSYGRVHRNQNKSHMYLSTFMEWGGAYLSLWDRFFPLSINSSSGFKKVFDVAYAEFFKAEFDFRYYWKWDSGTFALRLFSGMANPFGNSENLPFQKAYFAGGVSDVRAWQSYSLVSRLPNQSYSSQTLYTETLKALLSLEYRYPIFGNFHGALFADMGNIWSLEHLSQTYDQVALGLGVGLRYDVGIIVVRLDIASKTFDPIAPVGSRWSFKVLDINALTFNLGLGYPF